jgi:hypothetical protein
LTALQRWLHRGMTSAAMAVVLVPPWGLRQPWRSSTQGTFSLLQSC